MTGFLPSMGFEPQHHIKHGIGARSRSQYSKERQGTPRVQGHPLNLVCCEVSLCCMRSCPQKGESGKLLVLSGWRLQLIKEPYLPSMGLPAPFPCQVWVAAGSWGETSERVKQAEWWPFPSDYFLSLAIIPSKGRVRIAS